MNTLAEAIYQAVLLILQYVLGISTAVKDVAIESAPLEIQSAAVGAVNLLEDPTIGLQGLYNEIVAARSDLGADLATILAAIGATQQTGQPVTLPTTPPAGYGGAPSSETAAAVWEFIDINTGRDTLGMLEDADQLALALGGGLIEFPLSQSGNVLAAGSWNGIQVPPDTTIDAVDFTTILLTDATPVDWANRVYSDLVWVADQVGRPVYFDERTNTDWQYIINCDLTRFAQIKEILYPTTGTAGAPVWPGLTGVTLGTPVALTPNLELTQLMHGVVVNISSVAPSTAYFTYGTEVAYRHIGGLAFFDDANATEDFQFLGFPLAVYLPKSLAEAGGVRFNVPATLAGTVTPFTIP